MDRKTTGIIATIVAALLCGCPGLLALFMGVIFAGASQVPGAEVDVFGSSDPQAAMTTGAAMLCLGVIFIAIPVIVGVLTLRNRPAPAPMTGGAAVYTPPTSTPPSDVYTPPAPTSASAPPPPPDEPLPPTS
jgi:hypothetical protein